MVKLEAAQVAPDVPVANHMPLWPACCIAEVESVVEAVPTTVSVVVSVTVAVSVVGEEPTALTSRL